MREASADMAWPQDQGHQKGWSAMPELPSFPSQHHVAGNSFHSDGSAPCSGAYGSLPLFPALPLVMGTRQPEVSVSGVQAALLVPWPPPSQLHGGC